ncbi:hypothetical protein [Pantoea ananatis]|uniref:hypothetical protein n=1 Tax=Pantoea ananas TaxID=553 RepID=UPI000FEC3222|nr:hypothetical protein [Pantoea ananatis]QAB32005.1 hypothetical protein EPK90_20500 [Pantoea ananatis]
MSYLQDTEDSIDSLIIAAEKTVRLRQRSVTRAERNLELAEATLAELNNRKDVLLIRSWGRKPDWQAIFDISDPTPAMYEYQQYWIAKKGLTKSGMLNCETDQAVFSVGFKTTTAAELAKNIAMVEFAMQYIRASKDNEKTMMIYNVPVNECCYSFVFNTETKLYGIATDSFMSRKEIREFSRLDAALACLQSISDTDIVSEPDALTHQE